MTKAKCIIKTVIVSGGSRGGARGARPPLFLDQTEARRTEKVFFDTAPPLPILRSGSATGYSTPLNRTFIRQNHVHNNPSEI